MLSGVTLFYQIFSGHVIYELPNRIAGSNQIKSDQIIILFQLQIDLEYNQKDSSSKIIMIPYSGNLWINYYYYNYKTIGTLLFLTKEYIIFKIYLFIALKKSFVLPPGQHPFLSPPPIKLPPRPEHRGRGIAIGIY